MWQIDRTELFGSVYCVTGMAGCGGATTTVTQQIVPTVQVRRLLVHRAQRFTARKRSWKVCGCAAPNARLVRYGAVAMRAGREGDVLRRTWQEEVVYLEGRVNSAYSQLTDAETKLKDLKSSDKAAMTEIEDKNRDLRRKYDRYCAALL